MELTLIPYDTSYLPDILHHQQELYRINYPDTVFDEKFYDFARSLFEESIHHGFVALNGSGELVGFYVFNHNGYLMQIFVCDNLRNQGVGKMLMSHYEKELIHHHLTTAFLHVSTINHGAKQFYLNLGYSVFHESEEDYAFLLFKNLIEHQETFLVSFFCFFYATSNKVL